MAHPHRTAALLGALSLAAALALPAAGQDAPERLDDARLREAWGYLLPEEQHEVAQWFAADAAWLDLALQRTLIDFALALEERDRGTWPTLEPAPVFDPKVHAPKQPIPRRRLDPGDPAARRVWDDLVGRMPSDPLRRAYVYDWTTREPRRVADEEDPELVFENALAGFLPLVDYAEVLCLRALDDGAQRDALVAFGHAYTDRTGLVYPGVTLYEAWGSGREIEMPDVDTIGIAHTLLGEHGKWVAPIPNNKQESLYDAIGARFADAKRHRGLREALAAAWLRGSAVPDTIYTPYGLQFHGLWEEALSTPATLTGELPDVDDWSDWLSDLVRRGAREKDFREKGANRTAWLDADRAKVRALLVRILTDFGAMERSALPPPKPKPEKDGPKDAPKGG